MKVYLIGLGMGDNKTLTAEAADAIKTADVFIGAKRMLEAVAEYGRPVFTEYAADRIKEYLDAHDEYENAAVLLSGDISFYSGAKKLRDALEGYEIINIPGVSSYSYMCGRLGIDITETAFVSLHGDSDYFHKRSFCNIVRDSKYTFVLLNDLNDINPLMSQLGSYGLEGCGIHIGSRLGYADENIMSTQISYMFDAENEGIKNPVSVIVENPSPLNLLGKHLRDDEFARDKVPMTKECVRALVVAKLNLDSDSVLYDIGAGTGSVSVEASLVSHDIKVYAIEKRPEGYVLINSNRCKFGCDNIMIINGEAPAAMEYLPAPTHVFIGGSGGKLMETVKCALEKNPSVRIVINTVALNSAAEAMRVIRELNLDSEITSVNIAKSKKAGDYDMMVGQNPVYIFSVTKKSEEAENE